MSREKWGKTVGGKTITNSQGSKIDHVISGTSFIINKALKDL